MQQIKSEAKTDRLSKTGANPAQTGCRRETGAGIAAADRNGTCRKARGFPYHRAARPSALGGGGLILRRPRLGTFVSSQPRRLVPVSIDYTGSLQLHAPEAVRTLLVFRQEPAGVAADLLKLPENTPVVYSERRDRLNGVSFAWDRGFIPRHYAKNLTAEDLGHVALVERWPKKERLAIGAIQQTVETVVDRVAARYLDLSANHPLLRATECYFDRGNRPCGVFITCYHPDLVQLRVRYASPAPGTA